MFVDLIITIIDWWKIAELALNNNHSLSPEQIACYIGSVGKIII
jgi:hypothetical protein